MAGTVFVNRLSGRGPTDLGSLQRAFAGHGVVACEGDELQGCVEAAVAEGVSFVGVAGGDGSIRCAASVLAGTGVPLLPIPTGTRNHFAGEVGIESIDGAVTAAAAGGTRAVDVGEVNGHCFVNNAGIGFYAAMVRERVRHEGRLPRAAADLAAAWAQARHGHRFRVRVDDEAHRAWLVFVGNGRYGDTVTSLASRQSLDEHVLDVRMLRADAALARTRAVVALLLGRLGRSPLFVQDVRDSVTVELPGRQAVDVALDGDVVRMDAPLRFRTLPGALQVLVAVLED